MVAVKTELNKEAEESVRGHSNNYTPYGQQVPEQLSITNAHRVVPMRKYQHNST